MIWLWIARRLSRLGRSSSTSTSARGSAPTVPDDLFGALLILALTCLVVMVAAIVAVVWALVAGGRWLLRRREPKIEGSIW